ncbi:MAG: hypothetical protein ACK55I_17270, partial [bacterium]
QKSVRLPAIWEAKSPLRGSESLSSSLHHRRRIHNRCKPPQHERNAKDHGNRRVIEIAGLADSHNRGDRSDYPGAAIHQKAIDKALIGPLPELAAD